MKVVVPEPPRTPVPFFSHGRNIQIVLSVLTFGLWLLVPLTYWLWRKGRRRLALVTGSFTALLAALIVVGVVSPTPSPTAQPSTPPPSARANAKPTPPSGGMSASATEGIVNRALKVAASDRQDFGNYDIVVPYTLGNIDHSIRKARSLIANGTGQHLYIAAKAGDGTLFAVSVTGRRLTRTCRPLGTNCRHGVWPGPSQLAFPKIPVLTAQDKARVRSILLGSVDHYASLLMTGELALGTTQYPTPQQGLAAFNDPNSAASRFRQFRSESNVESDLSFNRALGAAGKFFTAANEPQALTTWQEALIQTTGDLYVWVGDAVNWQIRGVPTSKLQADASAVTKDLAAARAAAIRASS